MQLHLKSLRPWTREDLRVIDGDFIRNGCRIDVLETFDRVQRVAVPTVACRECPFAQADGIDDERIAVPTRNRIPHEGELDIGGMRLADRNHAKEMHVLVKDDDRVRSLDDLLGIGRERLARVAVRKAELGWIVMPRVARGTLKELLFGSRQKRSHLASIEVRDARSVRV